MKAITSNGIIKSERGRFGPFVSPATVQMGQCSDSKGKTVFNTTLFSQHYRGTSFVNKMCIEENGLKM